MYTRADVGTEQTVADRRLNLEIEDYQQRNGSMLVDTHCGHLVWQAYAFACDQLFALALIAGCGYSAASNL